MYKHKLPIGRLHTKKEQTMTIEKMLQELHTMALKNTVIKPTDSKSKH
jgi:hypothetical protein